MACGWSSAIVCRYHTLVGFTPTPRLLAEALVRSRRSVGAEPRRTAGIAPHYRSHMRPNLRRQPSPRHGRGVFTDSSIARDTLVIEYTGELIAHEEAEQRYPTRPAGETPEHTFVLQLDEDRVIDANVGGNDARFINHSCAPNLEPIAIGDHMWLVALRDIAAGEELGYDYAIELDERHTPAQKRRFPCACGVPTCRGTLLRPKRQPVADDVRRARGVIARRIREFIARETDS